MVVGEECACIRQWTTANASGMVTPQAGKPVRRTFSMEGAAEGLACQECQMTFPYRRGRLLSEGGGPLAEG